MWINRLLDTLDTKDAAILKFPAGPVSGKINRFPREICAHGAEHPVPWLVLATAPGVLFSRRPFKVRRKEPLYFGILGLSVNGHPLIPTAETGMPIRSAGKAPLTCQLRW